MLAIFGFTRVPFVHPLSLGETFSTRAGREAAKRIQYGVQLRGLVTLLGPSGSGKTTLLREVLEQLPPSLYQTLTLAFSSGSSLDVLMNLAARLGLPICNYRGRLAHAIQRECAHLAERRVHPIVSIDDAQYLPNQALQDLRLLMNADLDALQCFTLVLSGHDDLEGRLRTPWLTPLRQRVLTWARLTPLQPDETEPYLAHRLKIAGVPVNLFTAPAVSVLHQLSGGLLRPLDRLAHHALLAAALDKAREVTEEHARLAAEEVGQ
jgi:type II secretory pathway predicted ATPase ExeA